MLGRARRSVLVIDDGHPRNAVAEVSHGYLTRDGATPGELLQLARAQLVPYPTVQLTSASVRSAEKRKSGFVVTLKSGKTYAGRRLLMATGVFDQLPDINGLAERWGKSVFVCPFCDGWELRDRRIAVYGGGRDAVELAQELHGWTTDLIVCAERDDLAPRDRRWIKASQSVLKIGKLTALSGPAASPLVMTFTDGENLGCHAMFISAPLHQNSPLFKALGCKIGADGLVVVDAHSHTSVSGCYAAGDSVTKRHQVIIAAASGASAAITANCDLLEEEAQALARRPK